MEEAQMVLNDFLVYDTLFASDETFAPGQCMVKASGINRKHPFD